MKQLITLVFGIIFFTSSFSGDYGNMEKKNIVEVASDNAQFSTLVQAVVAADLADTLAGEGPYTVFAPTNAAFQKLPAGTVAALLEPANRDKLTAILTYHVVPGKVLASDVVKLKTAKTVNGDEIDVEVRDGKVFVDGAQVVSTDIQASNGVIHVIDTVVMPSS